jgi:quinol monooxygenase YgiN
LILLILIASTVYIKNLVHVFVSCLPGTQDAFRQASLENARQSALLEPGIARFDVLQDSEDSTQFCLVEVYKNKDAPSKHKETLHYLQWRDTVANMMAEPRRAVKYTNVFPTTSQGWEYPKDARLE